MWLSNYLQFVFCAIWYHLYNFKKHEKHRWRSATFSKVAGYVTLLHCSFSRYSNWKNDTKSRNASHLSLSWDCSLFLNWIERCANFEKVFFQVVICNCSNSNQIKLMISCKKSSMIPFFVEVIKVIHVKLF